MNIRRILVDCAILIGSTWATLAVLDLVARAVLGGETRGTGALFRADPDRGHALTPGFKGDIEMTYRFPVAINSHGYRGGEWQLDAPFRIAVAGDSFVFGEPLPIGDGIVHKAEQAFVRDVAFFNLGVSGYGTAHVERTIRKECALIRPRHIFYLFYLNDTMWDNVNAAATTVVDGHIVHRVDRDTGAALSQDTIAKKLADAFAADDLRPSSVLALVHLRKLAAAALSGFTAATQDPKLRFRQTGDERDYAPENAALAADQVIGTMDTAKTCGAQFTMAILPSKWEALYGVVEPSTERLLSELQRRAPGLDLVDLRKRVAPGTALSLERDNHYNHATTDWVARELVGHLLKSHPELAAMYKTTVAQPRAEY